MKRIHLPFALGMLLLLSASGCRSYSITSTWRDREITIDGRDAEWVGNLVRCGSLSLGSFNDDRYLYLCLETADKNTRAQLQGMTGQSFTVWFDPNGGNEKFLAVRLSRELPPSGNTKMRPEMAVSQFPGRKPDEMKQNIKIEVLKNGEAVAMTDAKVIEVAFDTASRGRKLVYEMRVPLQTDYSNRYALQTLAGAVIGFGLETSEMKMPPRENKEGMNGGGFDRGMQNGRNGFPSRPGGESMAGGRGFPPDSEGMPGPGMGRGGQPPREGGMGSPGSGEEQTPVPVKLTGQITLAVKK